MPNDFLFRLKILFKSIKQYSFMLLVKNARGLHECLNKTERENSHPGFSGKKDPIFKARANLHSIRAGPKRRPHWLK